jgi:serine/threonine protein kinase
MFLAALSALRFRSSLSTSDATYFNDTPRPISDREIIDACSNGAGAARVLDIYLVKFGELVSTDEAKNQAAAYDLLCPHICIVPKAYRTFRYDGKGYILMEYIDGESFGNLNDTQINKVNEILNRFSGISGEPGALCGDGVISRTGRFWPNTYDVHPQNVAGLEFWLNSMLREGGTISLKDSSFSLCHLDLAPRNIIWRNDEPILIDWASAGFYPHTFEITALRLGMGDELPFTTALLRLQDRECYKEHVLLLLTASGKADISPCPYS